MPGERRGSRVAWLLTLALCGQSTLGTEGRAVAKPNSVPLAAAVAAQTTAELLPLAKGLLATRIDAAIREHLLPGAVIAVGRSSGLLLLEAYGSRALLPRREVMTTDTLFDLASLTKAVSTATLLMQLVDAGKVTLDAPVATYLPEFAKPDKQSISVRQLLLHDSGLPADNSLRDYERGPEQVLEAIAELPLKAAPGTRFSYSDLGFIVLGKLIERVTGAPLSSVADTQLFRPLGMHDTMFNPAPSWFARSAPTDRIDKRRAALLTPEARAYGVIRGQVDDPRAFLLGGVAGHAGLFSTASDLARFARMLLQRGQLDGRRVLSETSVAKLSTAETSGDAQRTLGWDVHSHYSRLRGGLLSERAFGHGGFTGTSLWIDPELDLFVVFLSNRVHPDGRGYVISLIGQITDLIVKQLRTSRGAQQPSAADAVATDAASVQSARPITTGNCASSSRCVSTGIDVLRAAGFAALSGRKVGVVVNDASRARDGTPTQALLQAAPSLALRALFVPEHGLGSRSEGPIAQGTWKGLPVYSLYGKTQRPSSEMLRGLDTVVFDLPDVGTRFFTYASTLRQVLEASAAQGIEVVVLDRPNPLGAVRVEGPVFTGAESFVNFQALPVRHGMTIGELAQLLNAERKIGAKLRVIPVSNYCRDMTFDETGLPWFAPSPNLPSAQSALLYPALGLLEGTNLSVGRGTDAPFAFVGAPFVDADALQVALTKAALPGVDFTAATITPRSDRYRGEACPGVRMTLRNPELFRPVETGLEIARQLLARHRTQWDTHKLIELIGDQHLVDALLHGASRAQLMRLIQPALADFEAIRQRYLLYPRCADSTRTN
jgi:uncharacterized protein YbbC (DUF1343 family)/CubicO group peptidase (beta-lactamase class C family)